MNNDLISRYIYAVTRHLPVKTRDDIEKELDSLIGEMLEARCGDNSPTEKDVKIVLMELGAPEEVAAQYSGDEKKSLISGMYYLAYKKILTLVLPIVAAAVFLANFISSLAHPETQELYMFILKLTVQPVGGALAGVVQAFAVITFVFAILEHKKVDFGTEEFISSLPQVPENASRIKPSEPIVDIIFAVISGAILLLCPQIICARYEGTGWIPVFSTEIIKSMWYLVVFWVICEIIREIITVIEGCHSKRLAIVSAITNTLIAVSMCIFLGNSKLINPVFIESTIAWYPGDNPESLTLFMQNLNLFLMGLGLLGLAGITARAVFKAFKYSPK